MNGRRGLLCVGLMVLVAGCPMNGDGNGNANDNGNDNGNGNMNGDMDGDMSARQFAATLAGDNEVPPITSDASGSASFELNEAGDTLDYTLVVMNGEGITQAHIHLGGADENGPVVAFLFGPEADGITADGEITSGSLTADDLINDLEGQPFSALLDALSDGDAYVNVHSLANPPGEVRGQILPTGT